MPKTTDLITDVQLRNLHKSGKPVAGRATGHFPGLTITHSKAGTTTWIYRYRFGGKQRELTIGNYPDVPIKAATKAATEASLKVKEGIDPALEKVRGKITRAADKTLAELARDYMDKTFPSLEENTIRQRKDLIENSIIPSLGRMPAREITAPEIIELLRTVGEKRSRQMAERTLTALDQIFDRAVTLHLIPASPCPKKSTIKALFGNEPKPEMEKIYLSEDELRALLSGLGYSSNADAVRILLSTAVRIRELTEAPWSEVDLDAALWRIPVDRKKEDREFICPLSPFAMAAFQRLKERSNGSPWVLPARHRHATTPHISDCTLRAFIHAYVKKSPDTIRRFTPHDCRHTVSTHLSLMGIDHRTGELCLNHATGTQIERIYNHDKETHAIRNAFNLLSDFLTACETGAPWQSRDNIIQLHSNAG